TESEHRHIEPAVMDSEIERLPDLAGFLKLASSPDWLRVRLRLPERTRTAEAPQPPREVSRGRDQAADLEDGWEHD
ncbi:MAG: type IV secretion system DNA-binding domain-containing protein, partial [Gammaproteobacteria bacterium]|nr:type IV secretion system DNA-binding domain-containing protein [Gammaproteobacteria bacterium]